MSDIHMMIIPDTLIKNINQQSYHNNITGTNVLRNYLSKGI
jgi:hypothetical protein